MEEKLTKAIHGFSDVVRIFSLILIGAVMLSVSAMLATAGRYEAAVPLIIGSLALFQLPALVKNLYRDLTGNY